MRDSNVLTNEDITEDFTIGFPNEVLGDIERLNIQGKGELDSPYIVPIKRDEVSRAGHQLIREKFLSVIKDRSQVLFFKYSQDSSLYTVFLQMEN